jgi:hypothetical protein
VKRKILLLVVIVLLVLAVPVSAKPKAPVGERIDIYNVPPPTFPAGEPFHLQHGWRISMPDNAPLTLWTFELEVDGVLIKEDYVMRVVEDQQPLTMLIRSVYNFPGGMTGPHTFTGYWYGRCQDAVDAGLYPGPCEHRNQVVAWGIHTYTIDFVAEP